MSKYFNNFILGINISLSNHIAIVGMILIYIMLLIVFYAIYTTLPLNDLRHSRITIDHLWWYFAVAETIIISIQGNELELSRFIHDKQILQLAQKPVSIMSLILTRIFGSVAVNMCFLMIVGWVILTSFSKIALPVSIYMLPLFFVSIILGASIFLLCSYIISMLEIFGPYSQPANWIFRKLIFICGGGFFPLLFFPKHLQKILAFFPLISITNIPANFMLINKPIELIEGIIQQCLWITIIFLLAFYCEKKMLHYLMVNGD